MLDVARVVLAVARAMKPSGPKPLELTLRLRNNLLKERRLGLGLTATEAAKRIGLSLTTYINYENLRYTPGRVDGASIAWRPSAHKIASFYQALPEDLWPDIVLQVSAPVLVRKLSENDAYALLTDQQSGIAVAALPGPDAALGAQELEALIESELLPNVPAAALEVLAGLAAGEGYLALADRHGVSRQWIFQLRAMATTAIHNAIKDDPKLADDMDCQDPVWQAALGAVLRRYWEKGCPLSRGDETWPTRTKWRTR